MKIAVTAQEPRMEAQVDPRFGRAPYFIIADTETDEWKAIENRQNMQAAQGAGIQSAETVVGQDVEALLTGHCGPKAFSVLKSAGVEVFVGIEGVVQDAIEQHKSGNWKLAGSADVEGHWA
mgnify:CR=1 FL=1